MRKRYNIIIAHARNNLLYRKQELEPDMQIKRKNTVRTGDYTAPFQVSCNAKPAKKSSRGVLKSIRGEIGLNLSIGL
jgi:hypothetical protein